MQILFPRLDLILPLFHRIKVCSVQLTLCVNVVWRQLTKYYSFKKLGNEVEMGKEKGVGAKLVSKKTKVLRRRKKNIYILSRKQVSTSCPPSSLRKYAKDTAA